MDIEVRVEGMAEVLAGLSRLASSAPAAGLDAASESAKIVGGEAKLGVPIGPGAGGHAVASLTATGPQVSGGGSRFPYFPWLDFGGAVGKNNSVRRPFIRQGRFIWDTYANNKLRVEVEMDRSITQAARMSGLEVD